MSRALGGSLLVLVLSGLVVMTAPEGTSARTAERKLFVVGDSISIAYGPSLRAFVAGTFLYDRKRDRGEAIRDLDKPVGANGGDSRLELAYLKELSSDKTFSTDVLLQRRADADSAARGAGGAGVTPGRDPRTVPADGVRALDRQPGRPTHADRVRRRRLIVRNYVGSRSPAPGPGATPGSSPNCVRAATLSHDVQVSTTFPS